MFTRQRPRWWTLALLAVPLLLLPMPARAIFPPLYQDPGTSTTVSKPVTIQSTTPVVVQSSPPVVVQGNPTTVASTPEPSTIVSVLMGLLLVIGYSVRKKWKESIVTIS